MPANVETMFYTRVAPWHGLGTRVENAVSSEEALVLSGLDWNVIQRSIMTDEFTPIPGYKANVRDTDDKVPRRSYRPLQGRAELRGIRVYGRIVGRGCEVRDGRFLTGRKKDLVTREVTRKVHNRG